MIRLLAWLLIRLTPMFWLGFVRALVRHVWQYHWPELRLPSPSFPIVKTLIVCCVVIGTAAPLILLMSDDAPTTKEEVQEELVSSVDPEPAELGVRIQRNTIIPDRALTRTVNLPPGAFIPDGTYCRHESTDLSPVAIVCDDDSRSYIFAMIKPEPTWDGESVRVSAKVVTEAPGPNGKMQINWSGVCRAVGSDRPGIEGYEFIRRFDGDMDIDFFSGGQGDMLDVKTQGNIQLSGCKPGSNQMLFIRGKVDQYETYSTHLNYSYFVWFNAELGEEQAPQTPSSMGRLLSEPSPRPLNGEDAALFRRLDNDKATR